MLAERYDKLTYSEFGGVEIESPFEAELASKLCTGPVRQTAIWYQRLDPPRGWYQQVYKGIFDGGRMQRGLRTDYLKHAVNNPSTRNEYTFINENWQPELINNIPEVQAALDTLDEMLNDNADWINTNSSDPGYREFANFLRTVGDCLRRGDYDGAMVTYLRHSSATNLRLLINAVETWDDPMGDKCAPQAVLAYMDRERTNQANADVALYDLSAVKHYGAKFFPAHVYVADPLMVAGALGKPGRPMMAFNIPNKQSVAEIAGHNNIQLHYKNMEAKNDEVLSPALLDLTGVPSTTQGVSEATLAHEYYHGRRFPKEWMLGPMRTVVREGLAAAGGTELTDPNIFGEARMRRVVEANLGYSADDSSGFREAVNAAYGQNQPSINVLLDRGGPYAVDGYISSRQAVTRGWVRNPMGVIHHEQIREGAVERVRFYSELAERGDPDYAKKMLAEYAQEKRQWVLWQNMWETGARAIGWLI